MKRFLTVRGATAAVTGLLSGAIVVATPGLTQSADSAQGGKVYEQAAAQAKAETFRATAPKLPAPREFKLPSVESYKLPNGLLVELVEDHRFPFFTASLGMKAGSAYESKEDLGLAEMTADRMTEGTDKLSSKQFAEQVDLIGGAVRTSTDADFTILSGSALS